MAALGTASAIAGLPTSAGACIVTYGASSRQAPGCQVLLQQLLSLALRSIWSGTAAAHVFVRAAELCWLRPGWRRLLGETRRLLGRIREDLSTSAPAGLFTSRRHVPAVLSQRTATGGLQATGAPSRHPRPT